MKNKFIGLGTKAKTLGRNFGHTISSRFKGQVAENQPQRHSSAAHLSTHGDSDESPLLPLDKSASAPSATTPVRLASSPVSPLTTGTSILTLSPESEVTGETSLDKEKETPPHTPLFAAKRPAKPLPTPPSTLLPSTPREPINKTRSAPLKRFDDTSPPSKNTPESRIGKTWNRVARSVRGLLPDNSNNNLPTGNTKTQEDANTLARLKEQFLADKHTLDQNPRFKELEKNKRREAAEGVPQHHSSEEYDGNKDALEQWKAKQEAKLKERERAKEASKARSEEYKREYEEMVASPSKAFARIAEEREKLEETLTETLAARTTSANITEIYSRVQNQKESNPVEIQAWEFLVQARQETQKKYRYLGYTVGEGRSDLALDNNHLLDADYVFDYGQLGFLHEFERSERAEQNWTEFDMEAFRNALKAYADKFTQHQKIELPPLSGEKDLSEEAFLAWKMTYNAIQSQRPRETVENGASNGALGWSLLLAGREEAAPLSEFYIDKSIEALGAAITEVSMALDHYTERTHTAFAALSLKETKKRLQEATTLKTCQNIVENMVELVEALQAAPETEEEVTASPEEIKEWDTYIKDSRKLSSGDPIPEAAVPTPDELKKLLVEEVLKFREAHKQLRPALQEEFSLDEQFLRRLYQESNVEQPLPDEIELPLKVNDLLTAQEIRTDHIKTILKADDASTLEGLTDEDDLELVKSIRRGFQEDNKTLASLTSMEWPSLDDIIATLEDIIATPEEKEHQKLLEELKQKTEEHLQIYAANLRLSTRSPAASSSTSGTVDLDAELDVLDKEAASSTPPVASPAKPDPNTSSFDAFDDLDALEAQLNAEAAAKADAEELEKLLGDTTPATPTNYLQQLNDQIAQKAQELSQLRAATPSKERERAHALEVASLEQEIKDLHKKVKEEEAVQKQEQDALARQNQAPEQALEELKQAFYTTVMQLESGVEDEGASPPAPLTLDQKIALAKLIVNTRTQLVRGYEDIQTQRNLTPSEVDEVRLLEENSAVFAEAIAFSERLTRAQAAVTQAEHEASKHQQQTEQQKAAVTSAKAALKSDTENLTNRIQNELLPAALRVKNGLETFSVATPEERQNYILTYQEDIALQEAPTVPEKKIDTGAAEGTVKDNKDKLAAKLEPKQSASPTPGKLNLEAFKGLMTPSSRGEEEVNKGVEQKKSRDAALTLLGSALGFTPTSTSQPEQAAPSAPAPAPQTINYIVSQVTQQVAKVGDAVKDATTITTDYLQRALWYVAKPNVKKDGDESKYPERKQAVAGVPSLKESITDQGTRKNVREDIEKVKDKLSPTIDSIAKASANPENAKPAEYIGTGLEFFAKETKNGAIVLKVTNVAEGSSAQKAGLTVGDRITAVKTVDFTQSPSEVANAVTRALRGDDVNKLGTAAVEITVDGNPNPLTLRREVILGDENTRFRKLDFTKEVNWAGRMSQQTSQNSPSHPGK